MALDTTLKNGIIPVTALALTTVCGAVLVLGNSSEAAIRATMRITSASSILLFSLAFTASSLHARLAGGWTMVLQARRRIGIAFAVSHSFHLATIILLVEATMDGDYSQLGDLYGGAFVYLMIYLMAFTSNNASVARLGAKNWKRLHTFGGYVIWLAFSASYFGIAIQENDYHWLFAVLCIAVLVLRLLPGKQYHD